MKRAIAGLAAVAAFLLMTAQPAVADSIRSGHWAGYTIDPGSTGWDGAFAQTVLPPEGSALTNYCNTDEWEYTWVGLGGAPGSQEAGYPSRTYPFVQNGFRWREPDVDDTIYAWYELWDSNAHEDVDYTVPLTDLRPGPGDWVSMRTVWGPGHNTLWFVWQNLTSGGYAQRKITDASQYWNGTATADFVFEDPGQPTRIPWFGQERFTHVHSEQVGSDVNDHGVPTDVSTHSVTDYDTKVTLNRLAGNGNDPRVTPRLGTDPGVFYVNQDYCG